MIMMKVLISDEFQEEGVEIFKKNGFEVSKQFTITKEDLKKEIGILHKQLTTPSNGIT